MFRSIMSFCEETVEGIANAASPLRLEYPDKELVATRGLPWYSATVVDKDPLVAAIAGNRVDLKGWSQFVATLCKNTLNDLQTCFRQPSTLSFSVTGGLSTPHSLAEWFPMSV